MQGLSPEASFQAALRALPAVLLEAPIGVAVSGGSDSQSLLVLAHRWAAASGHSVFAITVDHGLRPEARAEAEAVGRFCASLGISHTISRLDGMAPRQSALRRGRHAALAAALKARGGRLLLTGHTADDQAETFLMRARQGSGWYGLAGMRALSSSPVWPEGEGVLIARPLLGVSRTSLRSFLEGEGFSWADDPSNDNPAFERVRMRRLLCIKESLKVPILTLSDRFQTLRMLEDTRIRHWLAVNVSWDEVGLRALPMTGLPPELAARILGILLQVCADRETQPRGDSLARLAQLLVSKEEFKGATLGGVHIRLRRGHLRFQPEIGPSTPEVIQHQSRRLSQLALTLSLSAAEIDATARKESFFGELVPIF